MAKIINSYSIKTILAASILLYITACQGEQKPLVQKTKNPTTKQIPAPIFNEDSAFKFIAQQVKFGPRVPSTKAHKACAEFLQETLNRLGAEVSTQNFTLQAYNNSKLEAINISARLFKDKPKRVVLFAHWDSRHIADRDSKNQTAAIDGANDGASGVGVILEILRSIESSEEKPNIGIDVVFFDAEDHGQPSSESPKPDTWALGAQYWSKNKSFGNSYNPTYGILLDMVGAKDAIFPKEGHSMRYAKNIVEKVWKTAQNLGYGHLFSNQIEPYGITDDHMYVNQIAQIPTIDIIHYDVQKRDFGDFHHTHNDNLSIIHKPTLKAVGQTILQVIYNEP